MVEGEKIKLFENWMKEKKYAKMCTQTCLEM